MNDASAGAALVVFHDESDGPLSRLLKPGFRHVFCCLCDGLYWIIIDGQAGIPRIEVIANADYDLAGFFRDQGFTVVETAQGAQAPRGPFAVANCVGMVTAALGIRARALTPFQLFKHLRKRHASARQVPDESLEAADADQPAAAG